MNIWPIEYYQNDATGHPAMTTNIARPVIASTHNAEKFADGLRGGNCKTGRSTATLLPAHHPLLPV